MNFGDDMRVISGSKKGRVLLAVPGKQTRPTTDRIKETLFNLLGQTFPDGGLGLDLYAGTGALGIEALSRGLDNVIFVDRQPQAIRIIEQNLLSLNLSQQAEVYRNDAFRALKSLHKRNLQCRLIFLDPPYAFDQLEQLLLTIDHLQLVHQRGQICVETSSKMDLSDQIGLLKRGKHLSISDTALSIFQYTKEDFV